MTAFLFSSFWLYVYFNVLDGRGGIAISKEKVAFSSCYSNRILLGAKIPSLGRQDGYFFHILAHYRQIRRAFLACGVGKRRRLFN
ncbi:hypothetical protein GE21DRAFT_7022 [Neurospora crassa]|uniref:Secreted protein n=1 Tax=Neurospora crassa (strain ATCC 24698 / 74-OR23-1A / CBS 708.71 / DSM 1257 / FGSC 987) TaxID=367110 RepID=Q7S7D4_NEUCR|nr:hypothetical protein NCU09667 [Neurospora crassa OR74A]EAA31521.1 hypothetical protein NCU09667 [Neurospora crassa OR74A]KHE79246.1 hypothetical protein GE21DRAFT_7022 [Neurospora crassa]|eukprot:XP_960757.1 hypothetical protein NCU09667 [Neurospora crassa OR74A]